LNLGEGVYTRGNDERGGRTKTNHVSGGVGGLQMTITGYNSKTTFGQEEYETKMKKISKRIKKMKGGRSK